MRYWRSHYLPLPVRVPRSLFRVERWNGINAIRSLSLCLSSHPSGDPKPSRDDIEMTREIKTAAEALGIAIHDHLVIGRKGHASFRSLGLI